MTRQAPPTNFTGTPVSTVLAKGTILSRVHLDIYGSATFNPVEADVLFGGGRFDSTNEDPYPYAYAADRDDVAVAEALLRDVLANDRGARFLAKRYWRSRQASRVITTEPIELIRLVSGADLGSIGQDTWLTMCDPDDYPQTRAWAHWLREQTPSAGGFQWVSKRDPSGRSFVLFGDRCPNALAHEPGPLTSPCTFDTDEGLAWLRATLAGFRVAIRR